MLVDAFLQIATKIPTAKLSIVGQRYSQKHEAVEYEKKLIQQVASSPFSDRVSWLGIRDDVPDLMRQSTILIHPARQEPLGRVLLEAAASGLPIIATDVGGTAEILSSPELKNLLVPPESPAEIAKKVISLSSSAQELTSAAS
jgi:glycosyltransferase involved in cell wall biosynthesis